MNVSRGFSRQLRVARRSDFCSEPSAGRTVRCHRRDARRPAATACRHSRRRRRRRWSTTAGGAPGRRGRAAAGMPRRRCSPPPARPVTAPISPAAARRASSPNGSSRRTTTTRSPRRSRTACRTRRCCRSKARSTISRSGSSSPTSARRRANLKDKPVFVPDPNNQIIKSEKQTFRIEVVAPGLETPVGLRVPARRPPARHRTAGPPAHHRQGQAARRAGAGHAEGVGTPGRRHARRRDSSAVRARTAGSISPTPKSSPATWRHRRRRRPIRPPPRRPRRARRRGRGGPPSPPSMTVFVRGKIDKNNHWVEEQLLYRAPPELYTPSGSHYGTRFTFDKDGHLFYSLGERGDMTNAQDLSKPLGKIHRVNDDGTIPKDNPFVNTPNALPSIWSLRPSQPAGAGVGSGHRPALGIRTRPDRRRRDQHHREGQELRLGRDLDGPAERHHRAQPRTRHGAADRLLHADDRAERHRVLRRREVSGLEEQPVRRRAGWTAAAPARNQRPTGDRTRKPCSSSSAACARSRPARTACCTCCCRIRRASGTGLGLAASTPGMVIRLVPASRSSRLSTLHAVMNRP